jgi:hypothetical protein
MFFLARNILRLNMENYEWDTITVGNTEKPQYFKWKGIAFFSQEDKICIFGGRNIDYDGNTDFENKKNQDLYSEFEKNQLTEICLSTGICTFTNTNYFYSVDKK